MDAKMIGLSQFESSGENLASRNGGSLNISKAVSGNESTPNKTVLDNRLPVPSQNEFRNYNI